MSFESRYAIYFETDDVMRKYDRLLEHACHTCPPGKTPPFRNFAALKEHVQRTHHLFYCDLCIDHLNLFSKERKAYNRTELAQHRRKGDPDDTSHRGHPLCKFCDARFMDNDELFRHLRKDHYYCHFCDADGVHQYYHDYPALREHFASSHFLCEEGNCKNEQFTSVFRNKLDRQAHYLEVHAESKQAIRQARTLDIEFSLNSGPTLVERGASGRGNRGGRGGRSRFDEEAAAMARMQEARPPEPLQSVDISCAENFPVLGAVGGNSNGTKPASASSQPNKSFSMHAMRGNIANRQEEFPSLPSANRGPSATAATTAPQPPSAPVSSTTHVHLRVNSKNNAGGNRTQKGAVSIQYNRTVGSGNSKPGSSSVSVKAKSNFGGGNKENNSQEEYPSLGAPSKTLGDVFRTVNVTPLASNVSSSRSNNQEFTKVKSSKSANSHHPNKAFTESDFPSLESDFDASKINGPKNYHGMSKVSVPVSAFRDKSDKPRVDSSLSNSSSSVSSKAVKKKKVNREVEAPRKGSSTQQGGGTAKKRPVRLGNVFDGSDEEEAANRFTMTKEGDYTSLAAPTSSNVKLITAKQIEERERAKINSASLPKSVPTFSSHGDFPSLSSGGSRNGVSTDVSWGNKKASKGNEVKKIVNTDMTFHNSYGQTFSVPSSNKTTNSVNGSAKSKQKLNFTHPFINPANFDTRNKNLIQTISNECGNNTAKFNKFKKLSQSLRAGKVDGEDYYKQCRDLIGSTVMLKILPELLLLLPDIEKQQSVLSGFLELDSGSASEALHFISCPKCHQVLSAKEQQHHDLQHLERDFPSLGARA